MTEPITIPHRPHVRATISLGAAIVNGRSVPVPAGGDARQAAVDYVARRFASGLDRPVMTTMVEADGTECTVGVTPDRAVIAVEPPPPPQPETPVAQPGRTRYGLLLPAAAAAGVLLAGGTAGWFLRPAVAAEPAGPAPTTTVTATTTSTSTPPALTTTRTITRSAETQTVVETVVEASPTTVYLVERQPPAPPVTTTITEQARTVTVAGVPLTLTATSTTTVTIPPPVPPSPPPRPRP